MSLLSRVTDALAHAVGEVEPPGPRSDFGIDWTRVGDDHLFERMLDDLGPLCRLAHG
jgi:hypothetical protein